MGFGHNGFVPIPEIQFLAYLHNAEDQLRGEAATLPFLLKWSIYQSNGFTCAGIGISKRIWWTFS